MVKYDGRAGRRAPEILEQPFPHEAQRPHELHHNDFVDPDDECRGRKTAGPSVFNAPCSFTRFPCEG